MARKVKCEVERVTVPSEKFGPQPGVLVTCSDCEHSQECMGTSDRSVRRALRQLRETCPEGEENFYVADDD